MMIYKNCGVSGVLETESATTMRSADDISEIDFDLHGLVGVRLLNASPADVAAVSRQLGPIRKRLARAPDILIRFVDRIRTPSRVRLLGLDDAGFTDDAFLVLQGRNGANARVKIALEQIGNRCEIICERGISRVPLLIPILNLTALSNGALPLHASAFAYNGVGVLTTGWAKGGKTETLLAFMSKGATYVGDEWVYISEDGRFMYGLPQPIRVWDWHLRYLPAYRPLVGKADRVRLRAVKASLGLARNVRRWAGRGLPSAAALDRTVAALGRQLYVDMPPQQLFNAVTPAPSGTIDCVFFVASHELPGVTVQRIDPRQIARQMVFSLQYERLDFMSYYLKFRFAFPELRNEFIERAGELERDMLLRALADKESYQVYHPYPVPIPALFDAIRPLIDQPMRVTASTKGTA